MKTKILYILGIFMIIGGVTFIISSTSENNSFGIGKSFAELNFYQGTNNNTYTNTIITSPKYPVETIYERAKVTLTSNLGPLISTINSVTVTTRITIITRHSH